MNLLEYFLFKFFIMLDLNKAEFIVLKVEVKF